MLAMKLKDREVGSLPVEQKFFFETWSLFCCSKCFRYPKMLLLEVIIIASISNQRSGVEHLPCIDRGAIELNKLGP